MQNDRKDVAWRVALTPFANDEGYWPLLRYFQFGMSGTSPNDRAGTKRPASTARA